jgi:hypothetical protein
MYNKRRRIVHQENLFLSRTEIQVVVNRMRGFAREHPDLIDPVRVEKAAQLLRSESYFAFTRELFFPTPKSCGCQDARYFDSPKRKYTGPCKHQIAEMLIDDILAMRRGQKHAGLARLFERLFRLKKSLVGEHQAMTQ